MTPSVASVQRLAFFSLRIPDSELGCDVGSARDPIKRGVARLRSVTFSSSTMHDRDEIWVAKGRRRAGDGQATAAAQTAQGASRKTALWPRQPRAPHGKARSATRASRKSAVWLVRGSQNAPFREDPCPECAFPSRRGAREVWGNPPPGCGALWRMPQLGKCARATPRQAAGWVARGFANLGLEFGLTEKRILKPSGPATSPKTALCSQCPTKNRTLRSPYPLNMVPRRPRLTHHQGSGAQSARSRRCHSRGSRPWVCLRCPG